MIIRKLLASLFFLIPTILLLGIFFGGIEYNLIDRWVDGIRRLSVFIVTGCLALFLTVIKYEFRFLPRVCMKNLFLLFKFYLTFMIIFTILSSFLLVFFHVLGPVKKEEIMSYFIFVLIGTFLFSLGLFPLWGMLGISWSIICQKLNMNIVKDNNS